MSRAYIPTTQFVSNNVNNSTQLRNDSDEFQFLIDLEFRDCISDFGIAKMLNVDASNCTSLAVTKGYLAPG